MDHHRISAAEASFAVALIAFASFSQASVTCPTPFEQPDPIPDPTDILFLSSFNDCQSACIPTIDDLDNMLMPHADNDTVALRWQITQFGYNDTLTMAVVYPNGLLLMEASTAVVAPAGGALDSSAMFGQMREFPGMWTVYVTDSTGLIAALPLNVTASVPGTDTDGDGILDSSDPDDDNDGICDALDTEPLVASNNCTTNDGTNATLVGASVSDTQTCAAKESVDVNGTTQVFGPDGNLRLISEKVILTNTSVGENGSMEVINADPCPSCIVPPGYSEVQPIFFNKCDPCHTGLGVGGHDIGTTYLDAFLSADNIDCVGLNVGQCTIVRIRSGDMPQGAGCTGDPAQDTGNAACLTQAEQDLVQAWIDGGLPE